MRKLSRLTFESCFWLVHPTASEKDIGNAGQQRSVRRAQPPKDVEATRWRHCGCQVLGNDIDGVLVDLTGLSFVARPKHRLFRIAPDQKASMHPRIP